jgi:hypothetical protein
LFANDEIIILFLQLIKTTLESSSHPRKRRSSCVGPLGQIIEISIFAPFLILAFLIAALNSSVRLINAVNNNNNSNNNNNNNANTNMNMNMNMNSGRMLQDLDSWSEMEMGKAISFVIV